MRCIFILTIMLLSVMSSAMAEELANRHTVIHDGAEAHAKKILTIKKFTGQSASHGIHNNYLSFSPIAINKNDDGLYILKGQHYNIYTHPWVDDEGVNQRQDYAAYVILDGYISDIYPDRFVFHGNVKRFSHLEDRLIIGPCDITGDLVFEDLYYNPTTEKQGWWRAFIGTDKGKNTAFTCKWQEDGVITDEEYDPITLYN